VIGTSGGDEESDSKLFSDLFKKSEEELTARLVELILQNKHDTVEAKMITAISALRGNEKIYEEARRIVEERKAAQREAPEFEKDNAKPRILLPDYNRPISQFAKELGEFYSKEKKLFYNVTLQQVVKPELIEIDPKKNIKVWGFKPESKDNFVTLIEKDFTVGRYIKDKVTKELVFAEDSMSSITAETVLESDQFREQLPKLRRIYTVPIPTFIGDELVFPKKGYDERLMSWLPENAPDVRLDMPLEEAKALIEDIYSEFAFKDKNVDKYNAIANLLTPFCRNLYSRETIRTPIFFYIANRERAGKDYCAGVVGIVFEGSAIESPAISTERDVRDEEFRKEVFSALKIGRSRIHSSNNKGFLNSAELERVSTAEQLMDRLLGTSNVVTFPNYLELSLSANQGITYTPDLEKRSIFINLFLDLEDPNERVFKRPDLHGYVFEHRGDILSALYALVRNWVEKGKPACSKPFSSYPEWMRVVGGIMEAAGWPAPSQNSDPDLIGGDKETKDMKKLFELAAEKWGDQPVTKAQIVNEILAPGTDEEPNPFGELFGWLGWYDNLNKAKHGFGLLFKKYEGRILSGIKLEVVQVQKGHAERNQYRFVKLDADTNQPKAGQQDLNKSAENDTNTKADKKEMEGLEGLEGSTNPSNIENNSNNSKIGEYIETHQISQTLQTSAENSQSSNTILENQSQGQNPQPQPEPRPQPPPAPQVHEPDSPSFNAQAQAAGSIAQPGPVLDLHTQNSQQVPSPSPAGSVHNATQKEQTTMLMVDKPMQQEAPAEPHEQAPKLTKEEIAQRVYLAVKLSEKYGEPFWSDAELGEPNKKLYPALQGLTTGVIQEALKALQEEGYIMQVKPGYWHVAKDLHLVNLVVYNDPRSVYCPRCMRTTTQLYDYGGQWLCVDCLNELQHQNDDLYA